MYVAEIFSLTHSVLLRSVLMLPYFKPAHTNFLDISYFDHSLQYVRSELLFNMDITMQVIDISKNEEKNYTIIETVIL